MESFISFMLFVLFICWMLGICCKKASEIQNSLSGRDPQAPRPKHGGSYIDIPEEDEFLNRNNGDDWL